VSLLENVATLLILSYSRILKTCIESVSFVYFKTVEGNVITHWLIDPTFNYLTGFHIMLVIISAVLLVMNVIPLPFSLLFPSKVHKFKCTKRFKPIFVFV